MSVGHIVLVSVLLSNRISMHLYIIEDNNDIMLLADDHGNRGDNPDISASFSPSCYCMPWRGWKVNSCRECSADCVLLFMTCTQSIRAISELCMPWVSQLLLVGST